MPLPGNLLNWKILDERGDVVFCGHQRQCEEWLDMVYFSETTDSRSPGSATDEPTNPLPLFELASALLRGYWMDSAGAGGVPGEPKA